MKSLLRSFLINCFSLFVIAKMVNGFSFAKGNETLLFAALVLCLVNLFIKPLINILLLPINLITLGTFRWLVNVATLLLVTLIVPEFQIIGFKFLGLSIGTFALPAYSASGLFALILNSLLLSLFSGFLFWLSK